MASTMTHKATFRVVETVNHPHGGQILRLRLQQGEAPTLRELKGATMVATGPDGEELRLMIKGFALFGGRPSEARLIRTGRVDVMVGAVGQGSVESIGRRWMVAGPT